MHDYLTKWFKQKYKQDPDYQAHIVKSRFGVLAILFATIFCFVALCDSMYGRWQVGDLLPSFASVIFLSIGITIIVDYKPSNVRTVGPSAFPMNMPFDKAMRQPPFDVATAYIALNSLVKHAPDLTVTSIDTSDNNHTWRVWIDAESQKRREKYHVILQNQPQEVANPTMTNMQIKITGAKMQDDIEGGDD